MILLVRNLGRAHLGGSSVPCDVSWSHFHAHINLGTHLGLGRGRRSFSQVWKLVLLVGQLSTGFSSRVPPSFLTAQQPGSQRAKAEAAGPLQHEARNGHSHHFPTLY